jgi:tryptophan synthase alpha chain
MNRIDKKMKELAERGEKALVAYVTAGDPTPEATDDILLALVEGGADIIELGMPFSDPTADGPTIQRASVRALQAGMKTDMIFGMAERLKENYPDIPIVLFGYYNPVFVGGLEKFAGKAADSGCDGMLIVDLPPEESGEIEPYTSKKGLHLIRLATPTASDERIKTICKGAGGFLYYVTMTGITGSDLEVGGELQQNLKRAVDVASLPVIAGFGIAEPQQAAEVAACCDGVVVGSAIVRRIEQEPQRDKMLGDVKDFVRSLKQGIDG